MALETNKISTTCSKFINYYTRIAKLQAAGCGPQIAAGCGPLRAEDHRLRAAGHMLWIAKIAGC